MITEAKVVNAGGIEIMCFCEGVFMIVSVVAAKRFK